MEIAPLVMCQGQFKALKQKVRYSGKSVIMTIKVFDCTSKERGDSVRFLMIHQQKELEQCVVLNHKNHVIKINNHTVGKLAYY